MPAEAMCRDRFFSLLSGLPSYGLKQVQTAYWLAKNVHRTQSRDSGERYFEHPRRVALELLDHDILDARTIVDGLLHDVLEDTYTPPPVICQLFGSDTYRDLTLLSKKLPAMDEVTGQIQGWISKLTEEYFTALMRAPHHVRLVKCADRLDNLKSCDIWPTDRIRRYRTETERLIIPLAQITDQDFLAKLRHELDRLRSR